MSRQPPARRVSWLAAMLVSLALFLLLGLVGIPLVMDAVLGGPGQEATLNIPVPTLTPTAGVTPSYGVVVRSAGARGAEQAPVLLVERPARRPDEGRRRVR